MRKHAKLFFLVIILALAILVFTACGSANTKSYTITFKSNGGSDVETITSICGKAITQPENPSKVGYEFAGWYENPSFTGTAFIFSFMPDRYVTVYAKWETKQITVSFNSNGGSAVNSITKAFGGDLTEPAAPTRAGYEFEGWYDETLVNQYTFETMPSENITLYAKWVEEPVVISFSSNGGNEVSSILARPGEAITQPENPSRAGYNFAGWYEDPDFEGTTFVFSYMPNVNTNLYAKWDPKQITISFESNEGSEVETITQVFGSSVTAPADPTRIGYNFAGWFDEALENEYEFGVMPPENATLYAKWEAKQITLNFESNGGSAVESITQAFGSIITAPPAPSKLNYDFDGWFDETLENEYEFDTMPAEDLTLYAKWAKLYIINFDSNGGTEVASIVERAEFSITQPEDPEKDGYFFVDWYEDPDFTGSAFDFVTMPARDVTLYARWEEVLDTSDGLSGETAYFAEIGKMYDTELEDEGIVYYYFIPTHIGWYKITTYGEIVGAEKGIELQDAQGVLLESDVSSDDFNLFYEFGEFEIGEPYFLKISVTGTPTSIEFSFDINRYIPIPGEYFEFAIEIEEDSMISVSDNSYGKYAFYSFEAQNTGRYIIQSFGEAASAAYLYIESDKKEALIEPFSLISGSYNFIIDTYQLPNDETLDLDAGYKYFLKVIYEFEGKSGFKIVVNYIDNVIGASAENPLIIEQDEKIKVFASVYDLESQEESVTIFGVFEPNESGFYLFEYENLVGLYIWVEGEEIGGFDGFLLVELSANTSYYIEIMIAAGEEANLVVKEYQTTRIDELYLNLPSRMHYIWDDFMGPGLGITHFKLVVGFGNFDTGADNDWKVLAGKYYSLLDDSEWVPVIIEFESADPYDIQCLINELNAQPRQGPAVEFVLLNGEGNENIIAIDLLGLNFLLTIEDIDEVDNVAYYSSDGTILLRLFDERTSMYIIPDGVEHLAFGALVFLENLEKVVIPDSVIEIGLIAFGGSGINEIFYYGDSQTWDAINIKTQSIDNSIGNEKFFEDITIYFYSEDENKDGFHWRMVDGVPTVWGEGE